MFFFKKSTEDKSHLTLKDTDFSEKIRKKLEEIDEIHSTLNDIVASTQAANITLAVKLKNQLKNGRRSFASLSEKLNVGVVIVDYQGIIKQINPKGQQLLQVSELECVSKSVFDFILSVEPVDPPGERLIPTENFFHKFSEIIFNVMVDCKLAKPVICKKCMDDIGCSLLPEREQTVKVVTPKAPNGELVRFNFSILDNGPDVVSDITYVFVFRKPKTQ